jgi:hypothetical protein
MESGYSLMTLYVLHDPDMTLIGEILTDTSSSVPYETVRVSKSSEGRRRFRQFRWLRLDDGVKQVVECALYEMVRNLFASIKSKLTLSVAGVLTSDGKGWSIPAAER